MPNKPIGHTVDAEINIHGLDLSKIEQVDSYTEKDTSWITMDGYRIQAACLQCVIR